MFSEVSGTLQTLVTDCGYLCIVTMPHFENVQLCQLMSTFHFLWIQIECSGSFQIRIGKIISISLHPVWKSSIFRCCKILHSVKRSINLDPALLFIFEQVVNFLLFQFFGQPRKIAFCNFRERNLAWQLNRSSSTSYHQICLSCRLWYDEVYKMGSITFSRVAPFAWSY